MTIRTLENLVPVIAPTAYIDPLALVVGDVTIGEHSSMWPMSVARGDIHSITIGKNTNIQDGTVLHVTHAGHYYPSGYSLTIGDSVTVGHNVTLHGCVIGNHCLIGIGSIVLDGAVLEPYTLLGAGSLVSPGKVLEGKFLWCGYPAQKVRPLTAKEIEYFDYSANYYAKLGLRHKQSLS